MPGVPGLLQAGTWRDAGWLQERRRAGTGMGSGRGGEASGKVADRTAVREAVVPLERTGQQAGEPGQASPRCSSLPGPAGLQNMQAAAFLQELRIVCCQLCARYGTACREDGRCRHCLVPGNGLSMAAARRQPARNCPALQAMPVSAPGTFFKEAVSVRSYVQHRTRE